MFFFKTMRESWKQDAMFYEKTQNPSGILLRVRVQPGASKERWDCHQDELKIYLSSPPVEGKANKALMAFMAKTLGIRKQQITIKTGEKSRNKVLQITDAQPEILMQKVKEVFYEG